MKKQLTMLANGGVFLIGELQGNRLLLPRVFSIVKNGQEIMLSPLPYTPLYVTTSGCITYPVPQSEVGLYELWDRVTDPAKIAAAETALKEKNWMGPRMEKAN